MAPDADGFVRQEDFVQRVFVPCGTVAAGGGAVGAGEEDGVGDCVAAGGEAGFGGAHGLRWGGVV